MNKKVIIASDSTCDLTPEIIRQYDIRIVPLSVNLGNKIYTDGVDVDPEMIYQHYEVNRELPKTAAPSMMDFRDLYQKCTDEGYAVVTFTISSQMSSTYNNARLAASEFEDVYVVDTGNLSTGGGLLVLKAAKLAASGVGAKEIADVCTALVPKVDASFVVDDLEFLHKGGRCSAVAAFGANLLQLKPCITVNGGKMGVGKKYRGKFAAVLQKYVADRIGDGSAVCTDCVFVTHAGCDEEIFTQCVTQVKELLPDATVIVTRAGCTISSHCGRNTLGVLFIRK
ncbi:MAG: DegV family protein [Ruminococcaceae bacterium]|nr:DegV family protein [Oscillospiraceae bacterium]